MCKNGWHANNYTTDKWKKSKSFNIEEKDDKLNLSAQKYQSLNHNIPVYKEN